MSLFGSGAHVGAAVFALGLSVAGAHATGVASADNPGAGSPSVSAGPERPAGSHSRPARSASASRAAARSATGASAAAVVRPALPSRPQAAAHQTAPTSPATPISDVLQGGLLLARRTAAPTAPVAAAAPAAALPDATLTPPAITLHNNTNGPIWVYNLTTSGDYSIPASFTPVEVASGSPTTVTLAPGTGAADAAKNRIYIVEGQNGFTLPVVSNSGVDAFNPTAATEGNSFLNYSFIEYNLYAANGSSQYTIDTSYIDEWSLPIQMQFTLNGADWTGAVNGKTYGFNDFDTVVSQLKAAGNSGTPYNNLVWSGGTPWVPQPPATVSRIIGPDKVWTQQSFEPPSNVNMNQTGWVPTSYQNFVQYGSYVPKGQQTAVYPYAQDGTQYSKNGNFNFWKYEVTAPASTPYPIALRSAAVLDGFPADANGVYGFFTYPNDETAGQFTNIPTAVSLDVYVNGSADGATASVIPGGQWVYTAPSARGQRLGCDQFVGTAATDTFILNRLFAAKLRAPKVNADGGQHDIVTIDKGSLAGATSNVVEVVDRARFWGRGKDASQFVYDRSTGYLYYDRNPALPGYTGLLAKLSPGLVDPTKAVFVL